MTAPSNANTSGLEVVAWRRVDPNGKTATTDRPNTLYVWKASGRNIDDLVTAESAQARIAESEGWLALERMTKETIDNALTRHISRATAAEARADRLAKALERIAHEKGVSNVAIARVALQQEG